MRIFRSLALFNALLLTNSMTAYASPKWVCTKDGADVKVTGKGKKEKQQDCEKQGGKWEKAQAASGKPAGSPAPAAGGGTGGGW